MADPCLFCRIVAREIPSHAVFDDAATYAFLDIQPLAEGHTLVIPRRHARHVEDMTADDAAALMRTIHRLVPRIAKAVGAPASTIAFNNGAEAGQEVGHVHAHIVPRRRDDGAGPIHSMFPRRPKADPASLAALAAKVRV